MIGQPGFSELPSVWLHLPIEQQQPLVRLLAQLAVKYVVEQHGDGRRGGQDGHTAR